jgi:protein-S-isoprenylcysteine O-methyltransferase Ste14
MEQNDHDPQGPTRPQPPLREDPLAADVPPGPSRVPWPPLFYAAGLILPALLQSAIELPLLTLEGWAGDLQAAVGWAVAAWGAAIAWFSIRSLQGIGTNVSPTKFARRLATFGPYAQSRNPIYLGAAILFAGLALATGNIWRVLFLPVFVIGITRLAILPEEKHLAERFPEEWPDYATYVRRWL